MTHHATRAVRAGIECDTAFGAVTPPIVLSSNFTFEEFGKKRAYDYSRSGNPTRDQLAAAMSQIKLSSQQTALSTQQTEQSIQALMGMAEKLEEVASRYKFAAETL